MSINRSSCGFLGAVMLTVITVVILACLPASAGTIVRFETNLGGFDVQLFDEEAPSTVANFLQYVEAGSYSNTFFHRTTTYEPTFNQIIQGGSYGNDGSQWFQVVTGTAIPLEATGKSNVRGTIAMARTDDPNSATSSWFFNVQDNSASYDPAPGNAGYAVFGEVMGDGLQVIDLIASQPNADLDTFIFGQDVLDSAFDHVPLIPLGDNQASLVMVQSVVAVPEPSTAVLAAAAIGLAAAVRHAGRRRRMTNPA